MDYQKITNLLGNTLNQHSEFRTSNWVVIIDDARGMYNINSGFKFKVK